MQNNGKTINDFSWKVAGAAGDGILNAGLCMFAKTCIRGGLYVFANAEYPSLIRGGHNHLDVRISDKRVCSHSKYIDLLIALNRESIDKHTYKLNQGGGIIYDGDKITLQNGDVRDDVNLYPVPLLKLAEECGGGIMRNTVAIGATFALIDFDLDSLSNVIKDNFAKKGEQVIEANIKAAKAGYDYLRKNFGNGFGHKLERAENGERIFLSGNEAISAGAVKAGCKFFAAYPMTPASSILHNMAAMENKYNIVVKHTEDEIAAINMVIGASFAGVRSMTATSGGGFALMAEGLGLAAQTETPIVAVEAQRPGPATGMATHSSQGDLRFMLHASTDEFPRIVIAPGDVEDCFYKTIDAFNLAEKYQLPVIILTDKYLGESYATAKEFDNGIKNERYSFVNNSELKNNGEYKRYELTGSGVSPRSIPSQQGGEFTASSYEHDEYGFEREEKGIRVAMHDKRYKKFEEAAKEIPDPEIHGPGDAEITIIGWGSTKGPILEAMRMLDKEGIKTNYLQVIFVSPFPVKKVEDVIKKANKTVIVENNKTAQMAGIIKENTGLDVDHKVLKYDGRPFSPEEICVRIKELMSNG